METSTSPATVLIVADGLLARGLQATLSTASSFQVLEYARGAKEAVLAARRLQPALVIHRLGREADDSELLRQLRRAAPDTRILTVSWDIHHETVFRALRAGAHRCILNSSTPNHLLITARALAAGDIGLLPLVALRILVYVDERRPAVVPPLIRWHLTDSQRAVLGLRALGQSDEEIAVNTGFDVDEVRMAFRETLSVLHRLDHLDQLLDGKSPLPIPWERSPH